jgi:hypothetical protein
MDHWHAYSYTGPWRPADREARDPSSATPPLIVAEWVRKPRTMLAGTFTQAQEALAWLAREVAQTPPPASGLPVPVLLAYARARLGEQPGDQVTRYYTASAYVVRDLVRCTGGEGCPDRPGGSA